MKDLWKKPKETVISELENEQQKQLLVI